MTVLLDTDILIDVALDRKPFSDYSSEVLDNAEQRVFQAYVAWHSLSNFYYVVSSSAPKVDAKDFLTDLLTFVEVAPTGTKDALYATSLEIGDFEDALQIAAAKACEAEMIVTRNVKHYRGSPIQVHLPQQFLRNLGP